MYNVHVMYVHTKIKPFVNVILSVSCDRMGIILYRYLEYQSVCPFGRNGSHIPPFPQASVSPSPWNQRGGRQHSLAGEEAVGANSDDWRESLALCLLCDGDKNKH
jgi:hypothetical protein